MSAFTRLQEQLMIRSALKTARHYAGPESSAHSFDADEVFEIVAQACRNYAQACLVRVRVTAADIESAARLTIEMAEAGL